MEPARVELRCERQLKMVLYPVLHVIEITCNECRKDDREPVHWFDSETGERLTYDEVRQRQERRAA